MYVGKERRNRFVALALAIALVAGVVLALLATVAGAAPAGAAPAGAMPAGAMPAVLPAHASLTSIAPANGAHLDHAPTQILLTFDDVVSPDFAQVILTRDGQPVDVSAPKVDQGQVSVAVTGDTGPGAYRIAWKVTSDDGHPVSGESAFGVGAAGAVTRPQVTPTYKTPQMQPTTFGHRDHLPGLIVAGVLLLGGVALLVFEHRRRSHDDQPIS